MKRRKELIQIMVMIVGGERKGRSIRKSDIDVMTVMMMTIGTVVERNIVMEGAILHAVVRGRTILGVVDDDTRSITSAEKNVVVAGALIVVSRRNDIRTGNMGEVRGERVGIVVAAMMMVVKNKGDEWVGV